MRVFIPSRLHMLSHYERTISYGFGEPAVPVPAYAATVYKSQGSGYPAAAIPRWDSNAL